MHIHTCKLLWRASWPHSDSVLTISDCERSSFENDLPPRHCCEDVLTPGNRMCVTNHCLVGWHLIVTTHTHWPIAFQNCHNGCHPLRELPQVIIPLLWCCSNSASTISFNVNGTQMQPVECWRYLGVHVKWGLVTGDHTKLVLENSFMRFEDLSILGPGAEDEIKSKTCVDSLSEHNQFCAAIFRFLSASTFFK